MRNDKAKNMSTNQHGNDESFTLGDRGDHVSVVDRYYTRKYKTDIEGSQSHDQCILLHSNKVCVVTVAKSHPILAEGRTVKSVNFQMEGGINRMDNKVSGKGKRGAQKLKAHSPVCRVTCGDGTTFTLLSCVKGMLIEVNERLIDNPSLITEKPETDGYLAIILPPLREYQAVVSKLDSQEKYDQTLQQRQRTGAGKSLGETTIAETTQLAEIPCMTETVAAENAPTAEAPSFAVTQPMDETAIVNKTLPTAETSIPLTSDDPPG